MILNAIGEFLEVLGIKTDLIKIGDDLVKALEKGMLEAGRFL